MDPDAPPSPLPEPPPDPPKKPRRTFAEARALWQGPHRHLGLGSWTDAAKRLHPSPVLSAAELYKVIEVAAGVETSVAVVIYEVLTKTLATAVRNRQRLTISGFGIFHVRRRYNGKLGVRFEPEKGSWWGHWMPVLAYDASTLKPLGIWDGPDLLPFGHPDCPYASAAEVPLQPDWSWRAATPLPGAPPPEPYPHPVRPREKRMIVYDMTANRDQDPARRRSQRRRQRARKLEKRKRIRM